MPKPVVSDHKQAASVSQSQSHPKIQLAIQRSPLTPGLYPVSTPIGNLRDISLRALDVLASADLVLAEDTRRAQKLLSAYHLKPRIQAYHDHNVAKALPGVIKALQSGQSIALISDAGTPLINDPGYKLARACIAADIPVFAVPGASAPLAALVASGLPPDRFLYLGFLPPKQAARQAVLEKFSSLPATLIFFETAKRVEKTLIDMVAIIGGRQVVIARELTKIYEDILRGTAKDLLARVQKKPLRGEIVLLIGPPDKEVAWSEDKVLAELLPLIGKYGVKQAAGIIAKRAGMKKRDVYQIALLMKNE